MFPDYNSNVLLPISQGIRTAGHHILHTPQEEQPSDLPPRLPPCCNGICDVDSIEVWADFCPGLHGDVELVRPYCDVHLLWIVSIPESGEISVVEKIYH